MSVSLLWQALHEQLSLIRSSALQYINPGLTSTQRQIDVFSTVAHLANLYSSCCTYLVSKSNHVFSMSCRNLAVVTASFNSDSQTDLRLCKTSFDKPPLSPAFNHRIPGSILGTLVSCPLSPWFWKTNPFWRIHLACCITDSSEFSWTIID